MRHAHRLLLGLLATVFGCGATTDLNTNDGATTSHVDSGVSDGGTLSCQPAFVVAGSGMAGITEIPIYHRAAHACCPSTRGPAPSGQPYSAGLSTNCTTDSQCTSGRDGRCFPFEGLVGPGGCSYDQCMTDSDCPSGASCLCRSSASDSSANLCVAGGNCVLDTDCGAGGYCSPSMGCDGPVAYYCHTAADTCINDSDCNSLDAGNQPCQTSPTCTYDTQAGHWACTRLTCCPP